jgi:hypothetical protein
MLSRENSAPADDPMSRLEFCKSQSSTVRPWLLSRSHPELTAAVMLSASMDFAGLAIDAVRDVAAALHGVATSPRANDVTTV